MSRTMFFNKRKFSQDAIETIKSKYKLQLTYSHPTERILKNDDVLLVDKRNVVSVLVYDNHNQEIISDIIRTFDKR